MAITKPSLNQEDIKLLKKSFATKDDLKLFATKEDFRNLSKGVVAEVNKLLVRQTIRLEGRMTDSEEKFEKKVTEVKSEFFEKIDPVLNEVTASREERKLVSKTQSEHTDQLEEIRKLLRLPTHN